MKKVLFVFGLLLTLGMFCACSETDETGATLEEQDTIDIEMSEEERALESHCFDGIFVQGSMDGQRIVVWLNENPVETLSHFSLCYVAFNKSDLPNREYKEGNHILFKIKKHGKAYEDDKNGGFDWGIHVRYNCIVEPC